MFNSTSAVLKQLYAELKKVITALHITTQIITIVYLLYTVIAGTGVQIANVVLLVLTLAYFESVNT